MSFSIDLATHGKELKQLYDAIVSSDPDVSWAVFNYGAGASNALRPVASGSGQGDYLADFVEEFEDGKVQYGFARIDYNNLPKFVLVGWVGEGVPERTKGYFNAHYATVAKYFQGYHVQITARSSGDLSPSIIMDKVDGASGSKYSSARTSVPLKPKYASASVGASEDDWGDAPPVVEQDLKFGQSTSAYKPTKVDIASLKKAVPTPAPAPSVSRSGFSDPSSSYKPIGKVDIAALRAQAKDSKFSDDRPTPLQSSYQPIGKVDIAAIRAQASKNPRESEPEPTPAAAPLRGPAPALKAAAPKPQPVEDDEEEEYKPKSLKDRMAAFGSGSTAAASGVDDDEAPKSVRERMSVFSGSGRLTEMPKPKVDKTVTSRFQPGASTRGTAPALPTDIYGGAGSKSAAGFKDYGSDSGKTPAQLWAEKHGKAASAPAPSQSFSTPEVASDEAPVSEPTLEDEDEEGAAPSISDLRSRFANTTIQPAPPTREIEPEEEEEEEEAGSNASASFADITSRFAKTTSPSAPEPAAAPVLPSREPIHHEEPEPAAFEEESRVVPPVEDEGAPPPPQRVDPSIQQSVAAALSEGVPNSGPESTQAEPSSQSGLVAVVLYDYDKDEDNEISLAENEIVTDIEKVDADWWHGRNSKGEEGLFPANYVELTDGPAETIALPKAVPAAAPAATPSAVAEYDYDASEEGELSFPEGAVITEIDFVDEAWWSGVYDGERGLFPANYVVLQE